MDTLSCSLSVHKLEIERGEVYTFTVDRISGSNNGIIELQGDEGDHINVGPLDCEAGVEIEVEILNANVETVSSLVIGKCLTQSATSDEYEPIDPPEPKPDTSEKANPSEKDYFKSNAKSDSKNDLLKGLR